MSYELEMVICGTPDSFKNTKLCPPVRFQILLDPREITNHIAGHSKSVFFIVLLLDSFNQTLDPILTELDNTENVIAIFICDRPVYNLIHNQTKVFYIPKNLITCKTTSHAIRAYESASKSPFLLNQKGFAAVLEQKIIDLRRWLTTNHKICACHVLIIPVHTTDADLYDFQQRLIELCKNLCQGFEPLVCTLNDFIRSDKPNLNMPENPECLEYKLNKITCSVIKKIAPIRIYLFGNDTAISNNWSKLLIENEPDNNDQNGLLYDEQCTAVTLEPLTDENLKNLIRDYGSKLNTRETMPLRLQDIQHGYLLMSLDRANITLKAREMEIDIIALSEWTMNYHDNSIGYSSEFHTTAEAQPRPMEGDEDDRREMDARIQCGDREMFQIE